MRAFYAGFGTFFSYFLPVFQFAGVSSREGPQKLSAAGLCPAKCAGHGSSGGRMRLEHERNYGLGMDAPVTVSSCNTNDIMVWAWTLL